MILVVGSNHDDVLFFESSLKDAHEESFLGRYHILIGSIGSTEVGVIQDIYTSFVSSTILMYLANKYVISSVINVGRASLIKGTLNIGDVLISEQTMFLDVDQISRDNNVLLGQIPSFPRLFSSSFEMINTASKSLDVVFDGHYDKGLILSSSFFRQNKEDIKNLEDDSYLSSLTNNIVLDGEYAGLALSSYLLDIPCISIKVIEARVGEYTSLNNYLSVLDKYTSLGKAIIYFIAEISRTDVKRM